MERVGLRSQRRIDDHDTLHRVDPGKTGVDGDDKAGGRARCRRTGVAHAGQAAQRENTQERHEGERGDDVASAAGQSAASRRITQALFLALFHCLSTPPNAILGCGASLS